MARSGQFAIAARTSASSPGAGSLVTSPWPSSSMPNRSGFSSMHRAWPLQRSASILTVIAEPVWGRQLIHRRSEPDQAAHDPAVQQVVVALVDLIELVRAGHQFFQFDQTRPVESENPRYVGVGVRPAVHVADKFLLRQDKFLEQHVG